MSSELLVTNLIHGTVALVWALGFRRLAGPVTADAWAEILGLSLAMPVIVVLGRALGVPSPPPGWRVIRAQPWTDAILGGGWALLAPLGLLLLGTAVIFVVQELVPAWRSLRRRQLPYRRCDPRLEAALERVLPGFRQQAWRLRHLVAPRVRCVATDRSVAALAGLFRPTLLVSSGLLSRLDDAQLEAVVAHELAHLVRGGNLRTLVLWLLRALQALSPPALILGRNLFEAREAACDAIASRVTGRPASLASALLAVEKRSDRGPIDGPGALRRARQRFERASDRSAVRLRVRALLDDAPAGLTRRPRVWSAGLLLLGLLWAIG